MALPSTGPISSSAIQTEFGGSNPIATNEYYAGGAYVPAGTSGTNGAVPSSGQIDFNVFHGTAKAVAFAASIQSNQQQLNLRSWALANGWNGSSAATITILGNVYIWSDDTGVAGLTIDGSWPGGITLINNGYIMGKGGSAPPGNGSGYSANGNPGGPAISLGTSVTIQNNSYVGGGGGSGASSYIGTGGGGAGGGRGGDYPMGENAFGGNGGAPGQVGGNALTSYSCGAGGGRIMPGSGGTTPAFQPLGGGAGGAGGGYEDKGGHYIGGDGGGGGNFGSAPPVDSFGAGGGGGGWGANGGRLSPSAFNYANTYGGAGGKCVALNGNSVTWTATGTRYGVIA